MTTTFLKNRSPDKYVSPIDFNEIDKIVNEALETFNVPGAAIGLVVDDQIILSRGYGLCKVDEQLPVTKHTLFPIASCTKAFTALLLGQLVDEGKIAFDDQVIKYIPEFSLLDQDLTLNLTIRDLLAHRTGIARHDPIWINLKISRSEIIPLLRYFEPACGLRQEFQYNNFMYALAGIVIERVTGQSWEEAISARILRPLEMKDSNISIEQLKSNLNFSFPHAEVNDIAVTVPFRDLYAINPAGGINSNVIDMTKWVRLHLAKSNFQDIIQGETLQEMQTMQMIISSSASSSNNSEEIYQLGYGLGWLIGKYRGFDLISHGGDIDGFSSDISLLPTERIGFVILTNSSSDGRYVISSVRNQIFDKILGKESTNWQKKMQETRDKAKIELKEFLENFKISTQITFPTQALIKYCGSYEHPSYGVFDLRIENDRLIASYGETKTTLYFKSENVFSGQWNVLLAYGINPIIDISFFKNESGEVYKIEIPFEKFRSAKPIIFMRK
ncbi:MAG: serine hydrolase [Parachlamydiaceae bacterium]|nr:serine hydrolase [Parachlamydiaceae bacterium]